MSVYVKGGVLFILLWVVLAALSRLSWWALLLIAGKFSWEWVASSVVGLVLSILLVRWMPEQTTNVEPEVKVICEETITPAHPPSPVRPVKYSRTTSKDIN